MLLERRENILVQSVHSNILLNDWKEKRKVCLTVYLNAEEALLSG